MSNLEQLDWKIHAENAVQRLRDKFPNSVSFQDLMDYTLSAQKTADRLRIMKVFLGRHPKIDSDFFRKTGEYKFYPKLGIAGPEDMLRTLRADKSGAGLAVREIKDVWTNYEEDITRLEKQHKIAVLRNKKDAGARHVWLDDPTMYANLDEEFRDMWVMAPLPAKERIRQELEEFGFKVATEKPKSNAPTRIDRKQKKTRRGQKITNTHIDVFKDYSHKRPGAAR